MLKLKSVIFHRIVFRFPEQILICQWLDKQILQAQTVVTAIHIFTLNKRDIHNRQCYEASRLRHNSLRMMNGTFHDAFRVQETI